MKLRKQKEFAKRLAKRLEVVKNRKDSRRVAESLEMRSKAVLQVVRKITLTSLKIESLKGKNPETIRTDLNV